VVLRGRHGPDEQAGISADPDALPHPAIRGDRGNTDHTALNHSGEVTNEQMTVIVNRDWGMMLTATVVEEITNGKRFKSKPSTIADAIG